MCVPLKVGGILVGTIGVLQTLIEILEIIPSMLGIQNYVDDNKEAEVVNQYFPEAFRKRK